MNQGLKLDRPLVCFDLETTGRRNVTANPVKGCQHACQWRMPNGEVAQCYAKTVAEKFPGTAYRNGFDKVSFHPAELDQVKAHKEPAGIFIDSMSDLFGRGVQNSWIDATLKTMHECRSMCFSACGKNARRNGINWKGQFPSSTSSESSTPPTFMFGYEGAARLDRQQEFYIAALERLVGPARRRWLDFD